MGQIYGIKKNNKVIYIGQTINNYKRRWQQHKIQSKERKTALYYAFAKYGIENFEPFLIEECSNDKLNEREQYWIQYYNTFIDKEGYNMTLGGDTSSNILKKPVYQYDLSGNFIQEFESVSEAGRYFKTDASNISRAASGKINSAYNFLWSFKKEKILTTNKNLTFHKKMIYQYNKDKKLLHIYNSCNEAARAIGKTPQNISKCARGERPTAYGFIWSYNYI